MNARINVGITICITDQLDIWSNGINQNIGFLALLLLKSERIGRVFLLNGGNTDRPPKSLAFDSIPVPLVWPHEVTHELDVVIEMGAILPREWTRHAFSCGVRFCCFGVGHNYSAVAESVVFGCDLGIYISDPALRVETWGLEHHMATASSMMQILTQKPFVQMPHLWSPFFLEQAIKDESLNEDSFGFKPQLFLEQERPSWRVAIFEPNISVVKNCFIPMLACEHAYRLNRNGIDTMMVMNTFHLKEHPTFLHFALNLDLTRDHKATFEPRNRFSRIMMSERMNCIVAHHIECGLNYLYYDALYGGYPLFHNSEYLCNAGVGFYYNGFSAIDAGMMLNNALVHTLEDWNVYKKNADTFLWSLHPENPVNIDIFTSRLLHVASQD
jgi:hypothetical protein